MTILEALKSRVKYPLDENLLLSILTNRELTPADEYTAEVGTGKAFMLCRADLLVAQIDAAQVQEGGMSVSLTDKSNFITIADSIYERFSEPLIGQKPQPKITAIYEL